jgi:D-tyrosyl-tRNA(Tyr) deacylase
MRAVIQRVNEASVEVAGQIIGQIGQGLLVLLGVANGDEESDVRYMVEKISTLRMFSDDQGKMNRSLSEAGGKALVVSQFTLLGDTSKGRRPGFDQAAPPEIAQSLYNKVVAGLAERGIGIETGEFGAHMKVSLVNDGPVTFVINSPSANPAGL